MYLDFLNKTYPVRRTKEEKTSFQNYVLEKINGAVIETTADGKMKTSSSEIP